MPSPAQRINAERLALAGWCRAILLQFAHPLIAAGVAEHSTFRGSPLAPVRRLRGTVRAMLALSFGNSNDQVRAIEGILAIHRRVRGVLKTPVGSYQAGTPYSAEDPALVLWVHATVVESVLLAYERLVADLRTAEKDAYCAESVWAAVALGAEDAEVPRTWTALTDYLDREYASGRIVVGPEARTLAEAVLGPPFGRIVWPALWANRMLTVGWLPGGIRQQYGFSWTGTDARRLARLTRSIRRARRLVPRSMAVWPEARAWVSDPAVSG
jgi:uncharacterized protein (DUF2236 family)